MKKITLPLLFMLFLGCSTPKAILLNMPEEQFKSEHPSSKVAELSERRTVYRLYNKDAGPTYKFYYFKNGKLVLMDEGFYPIGATSAVPTPENK